MLRHIKTRKPGPLKQNKTERAQNSIRASAQLLQPLAEGLLTVCGYLFKFFYIHFIELRPTTALLLWCVRD